MKKKKVPEFSKKESEKNIKHRGSDQCQSIVGRSQEYQKELKGEKVSQKEIFSQVHVIKIFNDFLERKF